MNFKAYDILSTLIPGFLSLLILLDIAQIHFDKDWTVPYTAIAFLLGYIANTISSWLEDFYFFTWGGNPSSCLLEGNDIWKVDFYYSQEVKDLLLNDCGPDASPKKLFSVAMRIANSQKDSRVDDFNAAYVFSRVLLTTVLIGGLVLIAYNPTNWRYYTLIIPSVFILWIRCKQRSYYYSREIFNVYLRVKKPLN